MKPPQAIDTHPRLVPFRLRSFEDRIDPSEYPWTCWVPFQCLAYITGVSLTLTQETRDWLNENGIEYGCRVVAAQFLRDDVRKEIELALVASNQNYLLTAGYITFFNDKDLVAFKLRWS